MFSGEWKVFGEYDFELEKRPYTPIVRMILSVDGAKHNDREFLAVYSQENEN